VNPPSRRAPETDHSNKPWVVYGGLLLAAISTLVAVLTFVMQSGPDADDRRDAGAPAASEPVRQPTIAPDRTGTTTRTGPTDPPDDTTTRVLSRGSWSASKEGFRLTVLEIGIRDGRGYVKLRGRNTRPEPVTVHSSAITVKDPGGLVHEYDFYGGEGDWPETVPPGDTVDGTVFFAKPFRSGTSPMRVDSTNIFVPAGVPDLWNGLAITGIPVNQV
jgi:hypothetical protein